MFRRKFFFVIVISFVIASFFQWVRWKDFDFVDSDMWSKQAKYVEIGDSREFNFTTAYGHPGGTVIEGTIITHKLLKLSYDESLVFFLVVFNGLIISLTCLLCVFLKKNRFWWPVALGFLSINSMYVFSTPPTTIAAPLIVLLCLLTLYLYENKEKINLWIILFWSLIAGLSAATRFDIGIFCSAFFLIFLRFENTINWKKFFITILASFFFFVLFDPFMYFMPIQHIKDLVYKIFFHYAEFSPSHLSFMSILDISSLSFLSILLATPFFFLRKKIKSVLPISFMLMLFLMTTALYFIFLTSHYQAERYFMPIIFIWEVFLPLFIFNLTPIISFKFLKTKGQNEKALKIMDITVAFILIISQFFLLCLWFFV